MHEVTQRKEATLRMMEKIPTQGYLGAALASIALSAILRLLGKKEAAVFVGQWPPTFLLLAMAGKLLHPSTEQTSGQAREAMREASRAATGTNPGN